MQSTGMSKHDYSKVKYNPFAVPQGATVGEHYPALSRRAFFTSIPEDTFLEKGELDIPDKSDLSLLLSFVILFVERSSPFWSERDFKERQVLCLQALGVRPSSLVWKLVTKDHWYYRSMLTVYLQFRNEADFSTWLSLKKNIEWMNERLQAPVEGDMGDEMDARSKTLTSLMKFKKELEAVEKALFRDDETKDIASESVATDEGMGGPAELYALEWK
jgi:hypothetical protein